MSIDGIGKPGGGIPAGPTGGVSGSARGEGFRVDGAGSTRESVGPEGARGSEALQALQRGEVSLDQYVDSQVEAALQKLPPLAPEQLATLRELMKEQLRTDPVVMELVRQTTGAQLE
jgi:hypothetical protein